MPSDRGTIVRSTRLPLHPARWSDSSEKRRTAAQERNQPIAHRCCQQRQRTELCRTAVGERKRSLVVHKERVKENERKRPADFLVASSYRDRDCRQVNPDLIVSICTHNVERLDENNQDSLTVTFHLFTSFSELIYTDRLMYVHIENVFLLNSYYMIIGLKPIDHICICILIEYNTRIKMIVVK